MINNKILFSLSLLVIFTTYYTVFGIYRTIHILSDEYLLILLILPILFIISYFKSKLKYFEIVDYVKNSRPSLRSTVIFFLIFQVVDYNYEGGFEGMIKLWFVYWIYGIIALLIMRVINYYKNYRMLFG